MFYPRKQAIKCFFSGKDTLSYLSIFSQSEYHLALRFSIRLICDC